MGNGIHVNVRLDEARLCLLVLIGLRTDGRKELVALTDGYREATESWADLAIGDGALGFWGALREVFPDTAEQRCWFHYADIGIAPHRQCACCAAEIGDPGEEGAHRRH